MGKAVLSLDSHELGELGKIPRDEKPPVDVVKEQQRRARHDHPIRNGGRHPFIPSVLLDPPLEVGVTRQ